MSKIFDKDVWNLLFEILNKNTIFGLKELRVFSLRQQSFFYYQYMISGKAVVYKKIERKKQSNNNCQITIVQSCVNHTHACTNSVAKRDFLLSLFEG